jgi:hypothetical protein
MPMYVKFLADLGRYGELSPDLTDLSYLQQAVKRETENMRHQGMNFRMLSDSAPELLVTN